MPSLLFGGLLSASIAALLYSGLKVRQQQYLDFPTVGCPQVDALFPTRHSALLESLERIYAEDAFKNNVFERLGGVVRVPTESYDDMKPVGLDERWNTFKPLHDYFEAAFPLVYASLQVIRVNTYGLVFHWQGSEPELKPILLAAHQDVVPVDHETLSQWVQPPYSGVFDGTWVWGRGSADDKSDLVAQLITIESLLKSGFQPRRTIVLAYGIDEESQGTEGAGKIAEYLEERFGRNSFALLLDEGDGYGENVQGGQIFVSPGVSEKGYFDAKVEVFTKGGHSSVPPKHTSIGILSKIVSAIEDTLHPPIFSRTSTAFAYVQCAIGHESSASPAQRHLVNRALTDDSALLELQDYLLSDDAEPVYAAMLRTTQAVDIVHGGLKANALPELATAIINHRVAEQSSLEEVQQHIVDIIAPLALRFNLTLVAFGDDVARDSLNSNRIVLSDAFNTGLEPSPVTPTSGDNNIAYDLLGGTIKAALTSAKRYNSTGVVVSPSLGLGNTDTRFYWNLTSQIFRYSHYGDTDDYYNGLHTVNEAVRGEAVVEHIRFFTMFILNCDEATRL
ncbi:Carboxypeptidase S [Mycena kentingensis (nom. inval.)]|nr:Carboxypeptidase S [Mycena kentingensis (nom. inval.)]